MRESVEQLAVTGAMAGEAVVVERDGPGGSVAVQSAVADARAACCSGGSTPGSGYSVRVGDVATTGLVVDSPASSLPDQAFYDGQDLVEGFQYIETRDGTELSINVVLPGPIEDGPYPTVVEYSGYDPSNPIAGLGGVLPGGIDPTPLCGELPILCKAPAEPASLLAGLTGYAVVGVNVRGTGCSGGAYDFFETLQVLDGYDVIETVAAQDWVAGHRVGMVGLSYPGLSQLFVAQSQPPSLAAITPLSVYGDTGTGVVRPGGILNTGFAVSWADQVLANAEPSGTAWVRQVIADGDATCAANQPLRLQNVDAAEKARDNPFYTEEVAAPLDIRRFAGDIEVPVFLASAWQDEQTGPSFADLLDRFDSAPVTRFTLYNGLHADGFAPQILAEWNAFLDLYVADEVPSIPPLVRSLTPVFTQAIFGGPVELPPDRWVGVPDAAAARARFEAEPPVRVIFESGAGDAAGLPVGSFEHTASRWPDPDVSARRWWLTPDGRAPRRTGPSRHHGREHPARPRRGRDHLLVRRQQRHLEGPPRLRLAAHPGWAGGGLRDRPAPRDRHHAGHRERRPLGSLRRRATPTSRWCSPRCGRTARRCSCRRAGSAPATGPSSPTRPCSTRSTSGREAGIAPLDPGSWTTVRVLIPAFGHAFRAGSRIRIAINTPGGDQPTWAYELLSVDPGTRHLVGTGGVATSSVALPVLAGRRRPHAAPRLPVTPRSAVPRHPAHRQRARHCGSGHTCRGGTEVHRLSPSVRSTLGRLHLASLEQPEGALADVGELVGHDRVLTRLVEGELDEPAL